ncbi:MAG: hypothetical protein SFZ24_06395 [Planctomycetota bacterium]|nr:hypothetical protein [Planctomycetota bacterium]
MKKTVLIVLAVIGGLSLLCVGAGVAASLWLGSNTGPPENVSIVVNAPGSVVRGTQFDIVVTVTDTSGTARTIKDVDIYPTLNEGITFVKVTPTFAAADPSMGFYTYSMNTPVPANGTAVVTFTFVAQTAGTYAGDFDVSIDSIMRIHTTPTTITITEP